MERAGKTTLEVEVILDNLEAKYPNYRYNYANRQDFLAMIQREIQNIVPPTKGTSATVKIIILNQSLL